MNVSNIQEATIMAQTKEQRKAAIAAAVKKSQQNTDAIMLRPPLADGQKIRDAAKASGKTLSGYILEAVSEYMVRHPAPKAETKIASVSLTQKAERKDDSKKDWDKPCVYAMIANGKKVITATQFTVENDLKRIADFAYKCPSWGGIYKLYRECDGKYEIEILEVLKDTSDTYRWGRVRYYEQLEKAKED